MQRPKFDLGEYFPDEDSFLAGEGHNDNILRQQPPTTAQCSFQSDLQSPNTTNPKRNKFALFITLIIIFLSLFIYELNPNFIDTLFATKKQRDQSIETLSTHQTIEIKSTNSQSKMTLDHNQKTLKNVFQLQQQHVSEEQQDIATTQNKQNEQQKMSSDQNIQVVTQSQNTKDDDQFELNFVQTQFEGKQTQQSLAATAFSKMQNEINKLNKIEEFNLKQLIERKKLLQDISTLQVMIPDRAVENYIAQDYYYFSVSIREIILNSQLYKVYSNGQKIFKISLKQHMRAIIRTQLVHNVNFKGEINVKLSEFDKGKEEKIKAIQEIMDDESVYYESLYQLSKYNDRQLRFCIVVPSYNNVKSKLYLRNLDSIFMQDYHNYHVVYIDDASPDRTGEFVANYIKDNNIPNSKIKLIINERNRKALYNIYNAIHGHCQDGEIVGLIDGDDSLLGRKVLQLYNAVYHSRKTAMLYSNFLKILTNNKTSFGFGTQITNYEFLHGVLRKDMNLVGTHFMTFYSDIFKKIVKDDLCYDNGTFYNYAYDRAIITPLIEMAYPRVEYLPEITYQYRNDTGINDGTADWQRVSKIIMNQQPYDMLLQFPFIQNSLQKNNHQNSRKNVRQKSNPSKNNQELPQKYFKQDQQDEDEQD